MVEELGELEKEKVGMKIRKICFLNGRPVLETPDAPLQNGPRLSLPARALLVAIICGALALACGYHIGYTTGG